MKLFSAAVLATAVTANLQGEYSKLARGKKYIKIAEMSLRISGAIFKLLQYKLSNISF